MDNREATAELPTYDPLADPHDVAMVRLHELMAMLEVLRADEYDFVREMNPQLYASYVDVLIERAKLLGEALNEIPEYDRRKVATRAA